MLRTEPVLQCSEKEMSQLLAVQSRNVRFFVAYGLSYCLLVRSTIFIGPRQISNIRHFAVAVLAKVNASPGPSIWMAVTADPAEGLLFMTALRPQVKEDY